MTEKSAPIPVLNVDDFEPGRYARSRILLQAGFQVYEAGTGREALALIADKRPPLVILDVHLPDISGLEVCRQIKTDPELRNTMVLQLSASAVEVEDWRVALETGADTYLIDPVDPSVLIATVRALLRISEAERALRTTNLDLRRSNEELARFAHVASHDLQEPLRTMTSYTQLLVRRYSGQMGADADLFIEYIAESAMRMSALISDLLLYSHFGVVPKEFAKVNLNEVFRGVIGGLHTAITETSAQITSDELPSVPADTHQIGHLLQNLVSNAIKYRSDDPPRIHVGAARIGDKWLFSVKDNGIGFSPQYAEQIFEAFKRLDRKRSSGTGIGLAIARRVVQNHGGEIWAESAAGQGAIFYFTLKEGGNQGTDASGYR